MYTMHEAFARERMSDLHRRAAIARLSRQTAAARREERAQRLTGSPSQRQRATP